MESKNLQRALACRARLIPAFWSLSTSVGLETAFAFSRS